MSRHYLDVASEAGPDVEDLEAEIEKFESLYEDSERRLETAKGELESTLDENRTLESDMENLENELSYWQMLEGIADRSEAAKSAFEQFMIAANLAATIKELERL